jgi:hypothetical protein
VIEFFLSSRRRLKMRKSDSKKNIERKSKAKKTAARKIKSRVKILKRRLTRRKKAPIRPKVEVAVFKEPIKIGLPQTAFGIGEKERVEVSKFTGLEAPTPQPTQYTLPPRYYDNKIVLLARDPWWIHTYWDISEEKINQVISSLPQDQREGLSWALRVYDVTGVKDFNGTNAHSYFDINIHFEANNWYINVGNPESEWCVDIGLKNPQGNFYIIARSNITKTPYFGISDIIDEEWALPDEEYYKVLGVYDLGKSSLERRKKLEELIRYQISSGAFSPGISSLFSIMQKPGLPRKFFLEVWTELILYGRTEPSAELQVNGKRVRLREDGTFSLRHALPEGDFEFRVVATSRDKKDKIKITPAVSRYTK